MGSSDSKSIGYDNGGILAMTTIGRPHGYMRRH